MGVCHGVPVDPYYKHGWLIHPQEGAPDRYLLRNSPARAKEAGFNWGGNEGCGLSSGLLNGKYGKAVPSIYLSHVAKILANVLKLLENKVICIHISILVTKPAGQSCPAVHYFKLVQQGFRDKKAGC